MKRCLIGQIRYFYFIFLLGLITPGCNREVTGTTYRDEKIGFEIQTQPGWTIKHVRGLHKDKVLFRISNGVGIDVIKGPGSIPLEMNLRTTEKLFLPGFKTSAVVIDGHPAFLLEGETANPVGYLRICEFNAVNATYAIGCFINSSDKQNVYRDICEPVVQSFRLVETR